MVAAETDANNQQAVERMSVIMRTHRQYLDDTALLYQNLPSCNCCPYGYHIDLDFVRYCESLVNAEPSDGQLIRRDRRRSRKSLEVMLGLEDFYQWDPTMKVQTVQEVHHEVEPESPRVASQIPSSYSCYTYDDDSQTASRPKTTNSSPETSAFLRDALDDVVSDFERTLERTKKKDRKYREIPDDPLLTWGPYFDMIDSCVSGDGNQEKHDAFKPSLPTSPIRPIPAVLLQEKEELESLGSNGSEMSTRALFNIREQMAISLNRMKDLEEQVKSIPALQRQLTTLKEEKRQLQQQLKKDDSAKISAPATVTTGTSTGRASNAQFTPQRISPVALESLGSRILPDPPESAKKVLRRDVGVMCTQHTRDVGTLPSLPVVRSVGTNYASGNGILDDLFTRNELDDLIKVSLKEYDLEKEVLRKKNHISIGTQMAPQPRIERNHISVQTIAEKPPIKMSQGIMVAPTCRDAITLCKPDYKTVGSSDHKITDLICDRCLIPKRTVGCGPDPEATKSYLSLKSMDMPPRSLSFSLGENERLSIKRKTVGTQYQISMQHIGVQSSIPMDSIGIQHVPTSATKSCQYIVDCLSKYSDTLDLVKLHDSGCNTVEIAEEKPKLPPPPPPRRTCDSFMNTDVIRLMDHWTNTNPPPRTRNTFSNTDMVHTKDASCGDIIKPHISISCADNYCDSCKDAIKNLAKEFSKVLGSPILGNGSRIPRPTTLSSPRPDRKKFVRQNTYTISTPTPSPLSEHRAISDTTIKTLFGSLDSVNSEKGPTGKISSSSNECLTRSLEVSNTDRPPIPPVEQQQYKSQSVTLSTSQSLVKSPSPPLSPHAGIQSATSSFISESWIRNPSSSQRLNGDVTDQDAGECSQTESSQFENEQQLRNEEQLHQDMLLNQLATVTSEPRTKAEPSKEMRAALKVINDSLQKSTKSSNLKNANLIVQKEWFKVSSTNEAKPLDVEDYLDCFEEFSNAVLKYVVNMSDHNGNSAMHYAVSHGNFDVVSILLDSKVCDVNQTNNAGYTCIMLVSLAKLKNSAHRTVVQRLFQMADVNIRAKKHCQTALMLAVSHGNLDMVEMLLGAGADINIQDEDGSTALMCAAEHGRIDIVKYLLAQPDCDSLIQDMDGSTAFKIAWQAGHRDIGLLLYVHEQMLRSKMPARSDQRSQAHPRHQKHH